MNRSRKIVIGTVACAFAVLILLPAAVTIAPKVVDTETVIAKVRSELLKVKDWPVILRLQSYKLPL